ncbi:Lipoprotein Rz1 precursor [compost metagenome]
MKKMKIHYCAISLPLVLVGSASQADVRPLIAVPPPAAWAMEPPLKSLEILDRIFLLSDRTSSGTEKN